MGSGATRSCSQCIKGAIKPELGAMPCTTCVEPETTIGTGSATCGE